MCGVSDKGQVGVVVTYFTDRDTEGNSAGPRVLEREVAGLPAALCDECSVFVDFGETVNDKERMFRPTRPLVGCAASMICIA